MMVQLLTVLPHSKRELDLRSGYSGLPQSKEMHWVRWTVSKWAAGVNIRVNGFLYMCYLCGRLLCRSP